MRKSALRAILAVVLVIGMMIPMLAAIAPVATAETMAASTTYPEENGWLNTNTKAPTDYAYSIAVVGDTQSMVKVDLTNGTNYMSSIYSWLAANVDAKNIQYVLGVGDITEYTENFDSNFDGSWTYDDEWIHAKNAITLLDDKVPYSLCRGGGHDTVKMFNTYFGSHSYFTENIDGTFTAGDYTSSYSTFEVGSVKYLLFTLDWNPSDAILQWAEGIIAANPNRKVIITTHDYLAADGTLHGSSTSHTSVPSTNDGVDIWEKLVSKYDNIQLVISGHNISSNLVYRQDARDSGSVVTSLLVDPQTFDSQNNGETGMVCMLYFSEDGNTVTTEWYSTVRDQYYKASNQFTLKLNEVPNEDGGIATKYGVIPEKYTDPDSYPFVTFVDGEFKDLGAYDLFNYASGTLERALRKLSADSEVVIVARKNIDVMDGSNGYLVTNYMSCKVTIDLMGYTVNANTATPTNLFSSAATQSFSTDLTVKNGTIILGKGLLSVSTGGADKVQNFTFEDLDIVSYYKELIIFNQYKTAGDVNIDFINCDITAANASALTNVFRAGNSGDKTPLMNAKTTVKGGSVTFLASDFSKFVQEYNGSTVSFLPNDNDEMTKITVPAGASVGTKEYNGANGTTLSLVKNKVAEGGDEYVFMVTDGGGIVTPYGTIPAEYASVADYPFVAFVNGEVIASDNIFIDKSGSFERGLRNKNTGDGVVIILRRDFTLPELGFFYTNYQKGTVIFDLMGHTVTNPYAENLFASNGTQNIDNNIIVKNGTLVLAKSLLSVSTHKNAPGKTQSFTFENLNITTTYNHLAYHNTSASVGNVNINYVNCNITATNGNINLFTAGKSDTDTNFTTHITIKGGSISLPKFDETRFTKEYNGGSVTFLPDEDGNYFTITVPASATAPANKYNDGALSFVKVSEKSGSVIYTLAEAAAECEHEYDNACDTTCNSCGEAREVAGHNYDSVVTAPTCTEGGYTTYTCVNCGNTYIGDRTAAVGHRYNAITTAPNCVNGGFTTYICACGNSYVSDYTAALGHSYNAVVTAPTCTDGGYTTYTCATCGNSYVSDYTEALDHAYDDDFDADCNNCGEIREVEVPVYTVAEGVCGVNTTWVLTSDGVLTISGNGDTEDYLVSITTEQPYRAYADKITKVVIEEGVTSIGRGAFYGFTAITEVVLPESLIAIHEYAFFGCTGITSISIPENTFYIGMYAFRKTGLTSISFADAEGWTFTDGTALDVTNVKAFTTENTYKQTCMRPVYEDGEIIANGVFGNKEQFSWTLTSTGLLTVSGNGAMPKFNVNTTPWYGYRGAIRSVVIEEGITSVGRCAFHTCRAITSVTLPESLETIAEYAFYNCQFLTEATIPANVTRIEIYAFRKCFALKDVEFALNYGWSAGDSKVSATELNSNAADMLTLVNYTKIWTRDINAEEEVLDPNYVAGGACNTTVKWSLTYIDDTKTKMKLTISGTGAMPKFETAGTPWYSYLNNIVEVEVCEGITEIGRCAFYGLKFVKTATIADTVTAINDYAFSGCFSLKSIEIPESVTFIADTAFTKTGLSEIPTV